MTTQRVVPHPSEKTWERHKATIRKLYLEENKTLDEVMRAMNASHGFVSTKSNYERRIRRWKFRKNHAAVQWKAVVRRVQSRQRSGKESNVYIDSRFVPPKKLRRKVSLYCSSLRFGNKISDTENPRDLDGVIIQTPPPERVVSIRTDNLPFVQYDAAFCTRGMSPRLKCYVFQRYNADVPFHTHLLLFALALHTSLTLMLGEVRDGQHHSNDIEFQPRELQIYKEQDSAYQPGFVASCVPPRIIDSLNHQQLAACHFQRVIPKLKSLLPSSATREYSADSSISVDFLCSTYTRLLLFSTLNNFAGLDDFPLECLVYYLQEKANTFLPRIRPFSWLMVKALTGNFFQAAASAGNDHVVEVLLQDWATSIGANKQVFVDGDKRYTALQRSCLLHHVAVTRVLLRHGADVNRMIQSYGQSDWSALELAIGCHRDERDKPPPVPPELVLLLVENGANFGYQLLRHVIMRGQLQVLEILLHKLVQVNPVDLLTFGFFHKALDNVDSEMAMRIINLTLQSNVNLNYGFSMIECCKEKRHLIEIAQKGNVDAVQKLFDAGAVMTKDILSYAIHSGVMVLIDSLLAKGANIDSVVTLEVEGRRTIYSTPLAESIRLGVPELTQLLQSKGALERITEERRFKAVIQAASEVGNVNFIRLLTDIDPDLRRFKDEEFLWHAITGDHEEAAVLLINHGARIQRDGSWPTRCSLTEAVKRGRSLLVRKILNAEPEGRPCHPCGSSPLQIAIKSGNISLIQDLIAAGTDVSAPHLPTELLHQSPLSAAVEINDMDLVALLIKNGAQINFTGITFHDDETVLETAVRTGRTSMIYKILSYDADPCDSRALLAAVQSNKSVMLLLLKEFRKRYPLGRPGYGVRVLGNAIEENDFDLIKLLLEYNVDASGYIKGSELNSLGTVWKTPLAIAIESNEGTRLQVVGLLLDAGVNPDSFVRWYLDSRRETALLVAIKLKSIQMVKFLLDSGASVNFPPNMGVKRTPLQQAAEVGDMAMIQILISHGAQVNDAPAYIGGATALQLAAIGGYVGIAEFLLQAGADLYASGATVYGQTALEGAAKHGRLDMVKFLINAGALNAGDRYRCSEKATRLALNHGHCAVVDLLRSSLLPDGDYYPHELSPGPAIRRIAPGDFSVSVASHDLFHRIRKDGEDGDLPLDVVVRRLWGYP
ncbi:uncharacterized protein Z518_10680 [Rhinocladiella mackenziei CBS 650.93]|uniref:Clr5 domain-containing protein n=1 Tax=Rhinocladiella mackenziei CBS 650.93 TaxID=1442369 RepID=A0A0D2IV23_9EURO|nr:uncharacterized protein Z518_10680 [Rhinocladiella mackenziei CBS 650.93]KIX00540.1 hypothetical protein Z518_10680 [Rhinocladiella mackenziei CBS 650.93]